MPTWKFTNCTFKNCDADPVKEIECSETLAKVIKAILAKTSRGRIDHLGIGVSRKFPRRANGKLIIRKINGRRVLTGHWTGIKAGPEAIDWKATSKLYAALWSVTWDFRDIYEAAKEVAKEHPEWRMSVILEPTWCHIEVNYPHIEGKC